MRHHADRLGRWRRRIRTATKLVTELACLLDSLTLLTKRASQFTLAFAAFVTSMSLFLTAL